MTGKDTLDLIAILIFIALVGYAIGKAFEGLAARWRGPLCSCSHPASQHATGCSAEGCRCTTWKSPNQP